MEKEKLESKPTAQYFAKTMGIVDPETRLKNISKDASEVQVHQDIPIYRYFCTGKQLLIQADVYVKEQNYESAYRLYMRFITIFLEKIREHKQYPMIPPEEKELNKQKLREVIPKAEELKRKLLKHYQALFDESLKKMKEAEKAEKERLKREEEERLKEEEEEEKRRKKLAALETAIAAKKTANTSIVTPDDTKFMKLPIPIPKPQTSIPTDDKVQPSKDKGIPMVDRSTKPTARPSASVGLRNIIVPDKLLNHFHMIAHSNTISNNETCGILAGKLELNELLVTHLLIPQQTGTPDSCSTLNEKDIFDYQDYHNLITLGWIHTHPTQTAFLSSVDLHTHCSYQLMIAEAIAIVCSHKYDEVLFFNLTPDYGLQYIANCRKTGFHPHPTEPPLYMKTKHCKIDPDLHVEVVDLRRK